MKKVLFISLFLSACAAPALTHTYSQFFRQCAGPGERNLPRGKFEQCTSHAFNACLNQECRK